MQITRSEKIKEPVEEKEIVSAEEQPIVKRKMEKKEQKRRRMEFPGGIVARTWGFRCCSLGSVPGLGTDPRHIKPNSQKRKEKKGGS